MEIFTTGVVSKGYTPSALREEGFGALQIVVDIARRFQRVRAGGELRSGGDGRRGKLGIFPLSSGEKCGNPDVPRAVRHPGGTAYPADAEIDAFEAFYQRLRPVKRSARAMC